MTTEQSALAGLGWQPFFQQQLSLEEWENASPARVVEYHRSEMRVAGESSPDAADWEARSPGLGRGASPDSAGLQNSMYQSQRSPQKKW